MLRLCYIHRQYSSYYMLVCLYLSPTVSPPKLSLDSLISLRCYTELETRWGGQVINDLTTTRIFRIHIQWPESVAAGLRCVSLSHQVHFFEPSCYQNHWPVSLNQSSFLRQFANIQHHKHLNFTPLLVPQTNAITFSPEATASLRQVELDLAPLQL